MPRPECSPIADSGPAAVDAWSAPRYRSPVVSIIVPAYNQETTIAEALASVAAQTLQDFELIVVDNNSRDRTREIAVSFGPSFAGGFRLIENGENLGPGRSRNRGVAVSRGSYLLMLDGDDALAPTFLEKTVAALESDSSVDIAFTDLEFMGSLRGTIRMSEFGLSDLLIGNRLPYASLMRRVVFEGTGGYDEQNFGYMEDWDFWIRATQRGCRARHVPEPLFRYRQASGTLTSHSESFLRIVTSHMVVQHAGFWPADRVAAARRDLDLMPSGWASRPPLRSISEFEAALAERPANDLFRLRLAQLYLQDGQPARALPLLEAPCEREDDQGDADKVRMRASWHVEFGSSIEVAAQPAGTLLARLPNFVLDLLGTSSDTLRRNADRLPGPLRVEVLLQLLDRRVRVVREAVDGRTERPWCLLLLTEHGHYRVHSDRDPIAEATRILRLLPTRTGRIDTIIVVGIGLGFLLDAVETLGLDCSVIACEPEPATVPWMIARRDLSGWLHRHRLQILLGAPFGGIDAAVLAALRQDGTLVATVNPVYARVRSASTTWATGQCNRLLADRQRPAPQGEFRGLA